MFQEQEPAWTLTLPTAQLSAITDAVAAATDEDQEIKQVTIAEVRPSQTHLHRAVAVNVRAWKTDGGGRGTDHSWIFSPEGEQLLHVES